MKSRILYYLKIIISIILILFVIIGMSSSIINNQLDIYDFLGMIIILTIAGILLYTTYQQSSTRHLYISPVAVKIFVSVVVILTIGLWTNNDDVDSTIIDDQETSVDYDVLYKSFIESLKANASKHDLILYNIDIDEENHIITAYIDNYQQEDISLSNDEALQAIYEYASNYVNLNDDIQVTIQFGNVINNQGKIYTIDNYYQISSVKNINGYYYLKISDMVKYQSKTKNTLYDKNVSYNDLISILNKDIDTIIASGVEIADFATIHDYEADTTYDIKQYRVNGNNSSDYNVGDYSNAYDFYYENQDTLSEDEAYEIYYDEYGEDE